MKRLLFILLMAASLPAFAVDYYWTTGLANGTPYPSPDALCPATNSSRNADEYRAVFQSERKYQCQFRYTNSSHLPTGYTLNSWYIGSTTASRYGDSCPSGSTYVPATGLCYSPPPPDCPAGQISRETFKTGTGPIGSPVATSADRLTKLPTSDGTCDVVYDTFERCYGVNNAAGTAQDFYCDVSGKMTGTASPQGVQQPASPSIDAPKNPAEAAPFNPAQGQGCPAGTVNLGTDSTGGSICGGSGTSPITPTQTETKQPTQTTTNADGSTTKTDVTTRSNTDGSTTTTTTKTTTHGDGTTTTTTSSQTSSGAGGGAGKDDSSDDQKSDFCKKNPSLNVCKNSSVSGQCAELSCTGDAIQCAIARQVAEQNCREKTDRDELKDGAAYKLGAAVMAGNDPQASTLPTKENAQQIAMESLEQGGFLGGGTSCLNDVTVSVMGRSVVLPFSKACPYIEALRYVMMTIAALVSLSILRRPILGD